MYIPKLDTKSQYFSKEKQNNQTETYETTQSEQPTSDNTS